MAISGVSANTRNNNLSRKPKTRIKKNLIIDTNLLLLLVIGSVNDGLHIKNSDRLEKFTKDDLDKVLEIILLHDDVYITPYIAAETSNLIDLAGNARKEAFEIAREIFGNFKKIDSDISLDTLDENFLLFGITDNSLINLARDFYILTDDHRMLEPLYNSGPNHIIPYFKEK